MKNLSIDEIKNKAIERGSFDNEMLAGVIKNYKTQREFCRCVTDEVRFFHPQYLTQILPAKNGIKKPGPIPPVICIYLYKKHGIPLHLIRPEIYPA